MTQAMNPFMRGILMRFILPILVPVVVGLGSAVISSTIMNEKLNERLGQIERDVRGEKLLSRTIQLETQIERHEKALERDFARHEQTVFELAHKTDDQEKRLTRLETLVGETQRLLAEISADVKQLLRGRK